MACSRGGGSPACGVSGVSGLGLAWNVAQGHEGDMCDSPETTKQRIGGLVGACHGRGGAELRGSLANEVLSTRAAYDLGQQEHKREEVQAMLTGLGNSLRCGAEGSHW